MYTKDHPFFAILKERKSLCGKDSSKETLHIVLDLKGESLPYKTGDSVAIFPINDEKLVEKTLAALHFTGAESVFDKRANLTYPLREALLHRKSLTGFSRKFAAEVLQRAGREEDPKLFMESYEVWDFLLDFPEVRFTPQEFYDFLMPLMPRFYSIASSSLAYPNEIHLTVAYLKYNTQEKERVGVCTHFLSRLAPIGEAIPLYVHPSHGFTLTAEHERPIIMIGPGTGVAPFRAFMQEREMMKAPGSNWLFFGERTRDSEYFYEADWNRWEEMGLLRVSTAFSRDQEEKIYVQHRLWEEREEIAAWIKRGAIIYVCGDKERMAKDVENTLLDIIKEQLADDSHAFLKQLRSEGRYLKDVY